MEKVVASLVSIGECMLELNATDTLNFKRSFAGDTYNTAVYAKRWQSRLSVYYISAIGTDNLSNEMLAQWKGEGLNTQYVAQTPDAQLGIYAISRDDQGKRCVSYWRKESAASQLMSLLKAQNILANLPHFDYVYFTGISLGILSDSARQELLDLIESMKNKGSKIVFDPNYRAKLWKSDEEAINWLTKAYQLTDIALPGMTDHKALFKHQTHDEVAEFLQALGCKEIIVKNAQDGIYAFTQDEKFCFSVDKNSPCIDTTAAGDSFAGTYIAARIAGDDILSAVEAGADVASSVVRHVGAITH
ncbi:sugar kinase [Catenovulum sp. 2E275]|uniref:sugar kinase n=1 Tax=Catenovulum sp. 2E275 TaxID=2980497 RepID=UPI0021D11427|nr:sugar kinase [Catenovulum sp. 2E275]